MTDTDSNIQEPVTESPMKTAAAAKTATGSGGPRSSQVGSKREGAKWGCGRTVVVADDEDIVRHLIQEVLQHDGFRVLPCESTEVALALCSCGDLEIDVLLADYHIGRHSGLWLARRALEHVPDLRIVLMSGDLTVRSRVRAAEIPAVGEVLVKPFGVRTLRRAVREALEG